MLKKYTSNRYYSIGKNPYYCLQKYAIEPRQSAIFFYLVKMSSKLLQNALRKQNNTDNKHRYIIDNRKIHFFIHCLQSNAGLCCILTGLQYKINLLQGRMNRNILKKGEDTKCLLLM